MLWAHYADSHKGFAIEYDFAALTYQDLRRRLCFPVFYTKKLRDATRHLAKLGVSINNLFGEYMCLIKEHDWSYEKEWRIIMPIGPDHANFEMMMPKPTAILLGSQVAPDDEKFMSDFCQARSIGLRRMIIGHRSFELGTQEVLEG